MVTECCFCGKKADKNEKDRTFHQFPLNQPKILKSWLKNMDLGSNFIPVKSKRLCSDHFLKDCLRKVGVNVKLVEGSVPTLFGIYKSACTYCSIKKTHEDNRSFHKFPLQCPALLEKWLKAMGREDFLPSKTSLLCSDHFEKNCFRSSGSGNCLRLRNSAVPSIFMSTMSEGIPAVTAKRESDSLQELPATKHSRLETENFASCSSNEVQAVELESLDDSPCIAITHHDVDCDSRTTMNSTEETADLSKSDGSNGISSPERTSTPKCIRKPTTPITAKRITEITKHDHQYENTPKTMRNKLMLARKKIKNLQKQLRINKQRNNQLNKRMASLKDIVSELLRTRALPVSGLACLDSIAETDVSQFLKRYIYHSIQR